MDIFAWQPSDMSGVPRELAEHYLNINPGAKPVKQAMRRFGDKKRRAIGMELAKLLEAGATYQRTMQRCLKDQIGRNVHAYVDDIAVMTRKGSDLLSDLKETFDNLRRYKMMLNPLKCVFGVPAGKLLGFIVSHRGIEVNPEKIKAILNIKRPTCLKDVQRLTGCVAAISRFVSRLGEKALPLYKLLKKTDKFVWDEAADKALQELKNILSSPPILAAPAESEPMLLYIAATNKVISLVIVVVRKEEGFEHGVQRPVYYISEVLTESKQRYPHFQKLAYGVFLGSRKLRHYFQEHPMTVVSKAPLATIINNSDATGRVAKWGIELSAFDINYEARTAIKSQVLADFIADWTEAPEGTPVPEPEAWVMHFDGSKQHQGSGAGVTLKSPTGEELQYVLQIHFEATNNMAEYEALLHGLRIAKEIGIKHIICCGDSDLVAQQVAGTWNARNSVMAAYRDEVDEIAKCFLGYEVKYVRRDDNTAADMLSKLGSGRKPIPPGIFLEHLRVPSVKGANPENPDLAVSPAKEVMAVIPAWTQPFLDYLIDQKLPEDEVHARQIIRRARSYTIVDGQLYKRSANGVFLKCVSSQDGIEILREIHAGDCGHHAAPRSLVAKAFRLGFYWLTATEQQPLATPKDNMKKAAELLKKKDEEIDINYVRKLVASAMQQQSKADTSRRLASNPEQCISTAQKDAIPSQHRDDESRTGSTERRRKVRDHPNPIPIPSDSAPKDQEKGKGAMYTGRDKYRVPSPPPRASRPPLPPRRRSPAGNPRPHGPGGINIRDSMPAPRDRNRERTLEQRRSRNQDREPEPRRNQERDPEPRRSQGRDPEPRRSRNEEYAPEPRRSRNDGGDHHQEERSHRSRSQPREPRHESEGGRSSYRPPRRSPSPPPSGGGGGGGGRGRRSRSRSKSPGGAPRDARDRLNEYRSDYIGPRCFGQMIREEPKPRSLNLKLPGNLKHYDGSERPDTWIEDYYNAVTFAGGTPNIACRMLQLYLIGPARVWLSDLEENTIFCWLDLKKAFENHFRGTYKRPATTSDLQACIQKKGETSRSFLTRWLATRNECENVDNRTAMHAFIGGLQRGGLLRHKLTCLVNANKLTLDEMINIASDHTAADDDAGGDLAATAIPLHQQKKNRDNGVSNSNKRKNPPEDQKGGGSDMVAMTFQRGGPGGGRGRGRGGGAGRGQQRADEVTAAGSRAPQTYEEYRDMPCLAHLDPATGKSTHTNRNCKWVNDLKNDPEAGYKRARKHRPRGKGGKGKNKDKEEDSSEAMDEDDASPEPKEGTAANKSNPFGKKSVGTYHTFLGTPTVRAKKSALRILNATVPAVPQYVKWSEKACTFDRSDHPAVIPKECYALVVSPRIDGYDFSKCLMDGGASLNIMYLETLEKMNLTKDQLKHSTTEFHGVVPGKKANSLGSIKLPVAFGDVNNYREEMITFEVVPFKSSYHVIFGRPTYHKFHARACYIYNKLKIPGPNGWITVSGDYKKARDCEEGEAAFAESVISGEELQGYRAAVDPTEMQTTKKQISEQKTSFKAAIETKKHDLIEGDNSKQVSVGANMDPK
ncbi:hypothetical protein QYE76_003345 [Lolium multiflorum]|uniref:Gag-pol polyprotein n=1 Tax=Lolium multiflorum TaxID=4521 RepID=A0AAD8RP62_LOLMU|nr:hypothetical protein QYE76_003345 [Lolium multiflorum]